MHRKKTVGPREARLAKELTQLQLAVASGVCPGTVSRAERSGKWPAQQRTRLALQRALGVEPAPKGAK